MNVSATDAATRIAAIQQMAAQLSGGAAQPGFQDALSSAQSTTATSATAATGGAVSGTPYAAEITAAANKYGIEPALLAGLVKQESGFNPNATSAAGAKGLTQLMPATAKSLGVTNTSDPLQQLDGGAKYLRQQLDRFGGDESKALAAYNAGPGAVQRYGGVPPYSETQNYVKTVLANRDAYRATALGSSDASAASAMGAVVGTGGTAATGGTTGLSSVSSSLAALDTGDDSSNLSLSTSSTSAAAGASSSLGYPTT